MTNQKSNNYHVVPTDEGWAVKKSGSSHNLSAHRTQRAAIDKAVSKAKVSKSEVVIHDREGKIRDKDSYGNDPHPPRDKKH